MCFCSVTFGQFSLVLDLFAKVEGKQELLSTFVEYRPYHIMNVPCIHRGKQPLQLGLDMLSTKSTHNVHAVSLGVTCDCQTAITVT